MKYKHYAPKCATMLFSYEEREQAFDVYLKKLAQGVKAYLMCDDMTARQFQPEYLLNLGVTEWDVAANLYDKLHEGERVAELIIAIAPQKQDGVMVGVMNRLSKACKGD
jgi:hypothetical protein